MNKAKEYAAKLKAGTGKGGAMPCGNPPPSAKAVGTSTLDRLKVELREAKARAEKAEAALAEVERVKSANRKAWRLNAEIARLKAIIASGRTKHPPKPRAAPSVAQQLETAKRRIEALEAELSLLRNPPS